MAGKENTTRWWENYLVRYFMPSIAGMAIVSWLSQAAGSDFKSTLFFNLHDKDTTALILLILYGNLFCYVASYPILCFHATRVIDFHDRKWRPSLIDGYILSIAIAVLAILIIVLPLPECAKLISAFAVAIFFAGAQIARIIASFETKKVEYMGEETPLSYSYMYRLSRRRGFLKSETARETTDEDEQTKTTENRYRSEIIDSYRHLREHGNSAFIFLLELVLASLCYVVFSTNYVSQILALGIMLGIWAFPAVLTHLIGQIHERRFSRFDDYIED